jgi:hypothetical protein
VSTALYLGLLAFLLETDTSVHDVSLKNKALFHLDALFIWRIREDKAAHFDLIDILFS